METWKKAAGGAAEEPSSRPKRENSVTGLFHAACDEHTPAATLESLARDGNWLVRYYVAGNPSTPPDTLAILAGDARLPVRLAAAGNPHTRNDVLERMSDTDGSQEVRETASYAMERRNYRTGTKGPQSPDLAPPTREGEGTPSCEAAGDGSVTFSKEETEAVRAAIRGFLKIGDACYRLSDVEYVEVKGNGHFVKMKGESSAAWVSDFNAPGARFVLDCIYR